MTVRDDEPDRTAMSGPAESQADTSASRGRRRWILIGAVAAGAILVLGFVVPRFAAGWLAKQQLPALYSSTRHCLVLDEEVQGGWR
jgi:hypothetical protein